METNSTQLEIILLTGTGFSSREWIRKDGTESHGNLNEQLEEACWNGLLPEMLPEIIDSNLLLWQIREGDSYLEIDMGEYPAEKDLYFSIDPHNFLSCQSAN